LVGFAGVVLGYWLNQKLERLKFELTARQTVRAEKRDAYCRVMKILGAMRYAVDTIMPGPNSEGAKVGLRRLEELREELYQEAPCAFAILGTPAQRAFEEYRKIAQRASKLDPTKPDRWTHEGQAISNALQELITATQVDLGYNSWSVDG